MNTKLTLLLTALLTMLVEPSFAQMPWGGSGYQAQPSMSSQTMGSRIRFRGPEPGVRYYDGPAYQTGPSFRPPLPTNGGPVVPASYLSQGQSPSGVIPASYCDSGCSGGACGGSCGGSCGGGLGGCGGRLLGLLGGGLGAGLGGGAGAGAGLGGGGWLDVEYLLWWNKERYIPALVTQSPASTPLNVAGQLGQPTTQTIFGNSLIGGGPYSGVRVSGGRWLDPQQTLGIGGRFFFAGGSEDFDRSSDGDPILARPVFDVDVGTPSSLLVAAPGLSSGSINVSAENTVTGFDVFLRKMLLSGYCNRLDFIGGYHNSTISDEVEIENTIVNQEVNRAPLGTTVQTRDTFEVRNQFNGGFVGLMGTSEDGPLSWNMFAKVAFGNMNQEATISGATVSSVPGADSFQNPIGFLALPTNIGSFDRDEFAIVPEINVNMGYHVTQNFQVIVGYTFIYWSKVALAGDLIDTSINSTQLAGNLVGEARPSASLTSDGFWYSGLSFGGSLRF